MTQQLSILELAKQGDAAAIAALINRSLQPKGIVAQASMERDCLRVVLLSAQVPNQKSVVELIHRGMVILQVESVKKVRISARKAENNALVWESEFSLVSPAVSSLSIPAENTTTLLGQPQNQKGLILVQKLSQLKRNQQEYQDIIIRFIDERAGTVRCLATLSELMQAINKSNFSFSSVATNPNLRNLLDTISEYSSTDEKGDQIITNVSVLQPGQPWQKVKIRLVTQVYFEPAQEDEEPTPSQHGGITLDVDDMPINSQIAPVAVEDVAQKDLGTNVKAGGFATVSENLLDDLIQDLEPNLRSQGSKQAIAVSQASLSDITGEPSLTVGDFLDDFGSEGKVASGLRDTSQPNIQPNLKSDAKPMANWKSQERSVEIESNEKNNESIDSLFDEFDLASEPNLNQVATKSKESNLDASISEILKSQQNSTKYDDSDRKEMITLDNFL
ncbi:hypothetical protein V2H45_10455 [Tumidithrix elongata RA019]|uniref:Uncharacterized protein n=1 Tax=Tumidithrix elongata BACA0141 TaxID=2716417 RepID=A0AAW9PW18_9CYAN|nr:hypothetical protein [Tumidithrix elongata RA019]